MSSVWTWAARSPTPSSTTTPAPCSRPSRPSTPPDYSRGVLDVLGLLAEQLGQPLPEMLADTHHIAHGTTSSLNALVTGNVPAVGFLTTKGHRDSIFIMNVEGRYLGRSPHELQHVLGQSKQHALLPKRHALEVTERIDRDGNVVVALDEDAARAADPRAARRRRARDRGVAAVVVPQPGPRAAAARAGRRGRPGRVRRAVVRGQPADPGVRPQRHHDHEHPDRAGPARLPHRAGGHRCASSGCPVRCSSCSPTAAPSPRREAPASAISTVGSVLTGGVVGSVGLGRQLGHRNIISTDVGGTTFLAGLIVDGEPVRATTTVINHHPINVPTLRVEAIGSGGGAIAWLDPGGNLRIGPRSAQAVPGPACYGGRRHRADQHRRQPGARHPPRTGPARRAQAAVARAGAPGHRHPDRQAAGAVRRGGRRGDLRGAERADRRPGARPSSRPATTRATSSSTPSAVPAPRTAPRYAAEVGASEVVVPLGPSRARSPRSGSRPSDIVLAAELSDPTFVPFDPARAERNFAELEQRVRDGLDRQGLQFETVEMHREIDMRYTMQLAEVTAPVADGPLDAAAIEAAAAAPSSRYAELFGKDAGFREAGIQAITFRVRGVGVLPFTPELPAVPAATVDDPCDGRDRPARLPRRRRGLRRHPDLRLRRPARGPRPHRACDRRGADHHRRRAAVPPAPSTTSATSPSALIRRWPPSRHRPQPRLASRSTRHDLPHPRLRALLQPPRRPGRVGPLAAPAAARAQRHPGAGRRPRPAHLRGGPPPALGR